MISEEVIADLVRLADKHGIVTVISEIVGKSVKVSIPFGKQECSASIDELDFSVRANNALKRAGIFTVGDVIDAIQNDRLIRLRNLGVKTRNEIKTKLLSFGYSTLTDGEKRNFLMDILNRNLT